MATARRAPTRNAPADAERRPTSRTAPARSAGGTSSRNYTGAEGRARAMAEAERQAAAREASKAMAGAPFRYFTPIGQSQEVIVVDEAPEFFRFEHAMKNPRSGKFDLFVPCLDESANCPACAQAERPAYFAMYLTVIDLTPYENKDGETVEFSKKLLVVKSMQQKKFNRLYEQHKTLRGMKLLMTRDSDKDATIGNDIEFIEFVDDEELATYVYSYTDREGKEHEVDCYDPFNYEQIMPEITDKQLRAVLGGRPDAGSREADDRELGRGRSRGDNWEDDAPTTRRSASRRDAVPEDDAGDAPPPRRGASRAAPERAAPARTAARRPAREDAIDPDDLPDTGTDPDDGPPFDADPEDAPQRAPRRAAPPVRGSAPARAPVRRAADRDTEDPPSRSMSVADRRASLRRGR